MLYICIPAFDEAPTIGLLLWRIRKVLEEHPREYELIVLDDGSTDATADTLKPYADVLPLTDSAQRPMPRLRERNRYVSPHRCETHPLSAA